MPENFNSPASGFADNDRDAVMAPALVHHLAIDIIYH